MAISFLASFNGVKVMEVHRARRVSKDKVNFDDLPNVDAILVNTTVGVNTKLHNKNITRTK